MREFNSFNHLYTNFTLNPNFVHSLLLTYFEYVGRRFSLPKSCAKLVLVTFSVLIQLGNGDNRLIPSIFFYVISQDTYLIIVFLLTGFFVSNSYFFRILTRITLLLILDIFHEFLFVLQK